MLPPFLPRSPPPPLSGGHPQSVRAPEANREVDHHGARKQVIKLFLSGGGDVVGTLKVVMVIMVLVTRY